MKQELLPYTPTKEDSDTDGGTGRKGKKAKKEEENNNRKASKYISYTAK